MGRKPLTKQYFGPEQEFAVRVFLTATTWDEKITQSHPSAIMMKKTDGTLWTWGYNSYGQLGQNNRSTAPTPQQIPGTLWNSISGSASSFCATQLA